MLQHFTESCTHASLKPQCTAVVACRDFPEEFYTLPNVWEGVKQQADYAAKAKEVEEFNRRHMWLKRGVAMTPTRWDFQ